MAALPSLRQAPPSLLAGCSINMFPTSCTLFPFPDSSLIATNRFKLTKPILNDLLSLMSLLSLVDPLEPLDLLHRPR